MPYYDYKCKECDSIVEFNKSIVEPHPTKCPNCDKEGLERIFTSAPSTEFKGKGWFKTDGRY